MVMLGLAVLPVSVAAVAPDGTGTRPTNPGNPPNDNRDRPMTVGFELNQSVVFGEYFAGSLESGGLFLDGGLFPIGDYTNTWEITSTMYSAPEIEPVYVVANWSDDLILHQFTTESKIRTEVVLYSSAYGASVYSIRANFSIVPATMGGDGLYAPSGLPIFTGNVSNGLWADGVVDNVYSAEVNQLGNLLYGYNWDEKSMNSAAGIYMLTFTLESVADFEKWGLEDDSYAPANYPYAGAEAGDIVITGVDDMNFDPADPSYAVKEIGFDDYSTWIVIELLQA